MARIYNAIIFDFDGTLAKTAEFRLSTWHKALSEYGLEYDIEVLKQCLKKGYHNERILDELGFQNLDSDIRGKVLKMKRRMRKAEADKIELYPEVGDTLRLLVRQGYTLGICSGNDKDVIRTVLQNNAILELFENEYIIGEDEVRYEKPDTRVLLKAIAAVATEPRKTLFVGDSDVDEEMAAKLHVRFINVNRSGASFHEESPDTIVRLDNLFGLPLSSIGTSANVGGKRAEADREFRLAEYNNLKQEIHQYQRFRLQILTFVVAALAVIIAIPFHIEVNQLFTHPKPLILGLLLAELAPFLLLIPAAYLTYVLSRNTTLLGTYILCFIESHINTPQWELARYDADMQPNDPRQSTTRNYAYFYTALGTFVLGVCRDTLHRFRIYAGVI